MLSGCINVSSGSGVLTNREICSGKPAYASADPTPCKFTFLKIPF